MELGGYETLKELGKALNLSPQTINSHKKAGRIPDKIAIRFCRIHKCRIDNQGDSFISEQSKEIDSDETKKKSIHYINDTMMNELINMLVEIRRTDAETFDSLYGRVARKYNDLKERKEKKLVRLESTKKKRPNCT